MLGLVRPYEWGYTKHEAVIKWFGRVRKETITLLDWSAVEKKRLCNRPDVLGENGTERTWNYARYVGRSSPWNSTRCCQCGTLVAPLACDTYLGHIEVKWRSMEIFRDGSQEIVVPLKDHQSQRSEGGGWYGSSLSRWRTTETQQTNRFACDENVATLRRIVEA